MILRQLQLVNFKNYPGILLDFDPEVNILTGLNGQGKTNVLDAIYYLSFCKSYFNPIDTQNIRHGEDFFVIEGLFDQGENSDKVYCGVKRGQRKVFKLNKEVYERLSSHIGRFPAVIISPSDKDLITEGSEVRRRMIDSIIAQYDQPYIELLLQYNRVLQQRNSLLKYFWENRTFDPENLALWTDQLIDSGRRIFASRKDFLERFSPIFEGHYAAISGHAEVVKLDYHSQFSDGNLSDKFAKGLEKDRRTSYSNLGVHKDDLEFLIGGHPLKKYGSQGQQKTFLIALKLAQYDLIKASTGKTPLLLLDDIFDKIDDVRVAHLLQLVADHSFGQIFITDTHSERISAIFKAMPTTMRVFEIEEGGLLESR